MYKQYLEIRDCKSGKGTFTKVKVPADLPILEFTGPVVLDREIKPEEYYKHLQVGPNTFIGSSGEADDYINHSCDPNCKVHIVGNRAFLYSLYIIPENTELTFDYSTTSTDNYDKCKINCNCGSPKCRKVISGHSYLDFELKEKYKKKNMLPLYILEPYLIHKR